MDETPEIKTLSDRYRLHLKWTERYTEAAARTSDIKCARMAEEHAQIARDIQGRLNTLKGLQDLRP